MSPIIMLLITTGVVGTILVALLIYRSTIEMHEDDQLFLDAAESHMAKEQEELRAKLEKVDPLVTWLSVATGALALLTFGFWVWKGLMGTSMSNF
jgi:anaerobic C4-dicarboxylate transporter